MKYIIVGGVAGGATAAARLRRIDEKVEIILFEKGEYISYANCGLPYYIGGVIEDRAKLFIQTPQAFSKRFNIDVRTSSKVVSIDRDNKKVSVVTSEGKSYEESYDKLLLSPGANPFVPPLDGIDNESIFTLRNVADTDKIKSYINRHVIKDAVIIGAGFIGLEMAENLHNVGAHVSIVEMIPQVMAPIDFSMASIIHQHLIEKGVSLYLENTVTGFEKRENGGVRVLLKSGVTIDADMVILSIGVRPNTELAVQAGLEIGEAKGIKVNEYLQTSDKDIYAVGDAIEFPHPLTGKPWLNYLAGPANRQARIVADNMVYGNSKKYEGAIGTSIAKVFDLTVGLTGVVAKRLKMDGVEYSTATVHPNSHAGYYPDAYPLTLKLTFDKNTGKVYSVQGVGYDGVDKRIDVASQVIKRGGTIYDLIEIEQAYAPPYSSAKDPLAVAGYVATNIFEKRMDPLYWRELRDADLSKVTLIDVRTADEYSLGHLDGAINIPLDDMRDRMGEISKDKPIWLYCGVGLRGYLASNILLQNGFTNVRNLIGGMKIYKTATQVLPIPTQIPSLRRENSSSVGGHSSSVGSNEASLGNNASSDSSLKSSVSPNDSIKGKYSQVSNPQNSSIKYKEEYKEDGDDLKAAVSIKVDACGISCPGPIMKLKKSMAEINPGDILEVTATDAGFPNDARSWAETTGNEFISSTQSGGKYIVKLRKNEVKEIVPEHSNAQLGKTFIMFSDDLDKALATFVLANGASAIGGKVSIFFTFWGLNVIKKEKKPDCEKDIFGKMFGMMLPSSSLQLKLSKMNMFGIGSKMMRYIMNKKKIDSLESLRQQAIDNGVEFIACQMSMDVMGVKKEELLDNVIIGGVGTYMNRADKSNINLFI